MPEYPEHVRNRASEMMPAQLDRLCVTYESVRDAIHNAICAALMETPPTELAEPGELAQWQIDAAVDWLRENHAGAGPVKSVVARALFTPPPAEPEDARLPIWREFMAARFEVMGRKTRAIQYRDGSSDDEFPAWIARHDEARGAGL